MPNLQEYDIDEQLPPNIDSTYYTIQDLATSETTSNDLALLHMNIRSLSNHFHLSTLLFNPITSFDVVAVSEIWDSFERSLSINV